MKTLRIIVWTAGGLVILALAAAAIFAATFDPNRYKDDIERIVRERTGRTLKLAGKLEIAFYPSLGAKVAGVTLSERAAGREFLSLESAHASVGLLPLLRGELTVDRVRVSGLKAQIVKNRDGSYNFSDLLDAEGKKAAPAAKRGAEKAQPVKFDIAGVQVERSGVTYRDLGSGQEWALGDLRLSTGRVAQDAEGKLEAATVAKRRSPPLEVKIALAGRYRLQGGVLKAELAGKVDESAIKAKLGGGKPQELDLSIDKLNLDRYLAPEESGKPAAAAQPAKQDTPIDLSGLKDLDAKGRLEIGALQARGLRLANVKTEIRAAGGRVEVGPHAASLYEGTLAGTLILSAGNRIALKETLSGVALGPLLRDVARQDRLEGKGSLSLDVSGAGASVNAMKRSLAGSAKLHLRDGAIKGINIAEMLRKAKSALGSQPAVQATGPADRTDFSELSASFAITNGVARNQDLEIKAPLFRVTGAGDIDLGGSAINYVAKASLVATAKGQGGAGRDELSGLTVPVRLSGPLDAMKYEVDYRAVAGDLAKSKLKDKLEERLKGLLRR